MIAIEKEIEQFHKQYDAVQKEMGRVIVGNRDVIGSILSCLFTRGHVLLEGVGGWRPVRRVAPDGVRQGVVNF